MPNRAIFRFIDYLTTNPRINDLCSHILNDFNLPDHPEKIRVLWKGSNFSIEVIGEYGYEDDVADCGGVVIGRNYEYDEWSKSTAEGVEVILGNHEGPWSENGNVYVYAITHNFLTMGYIKFVFEDLDDAERLRIQEGIELTLAVMNLYIIQEMHRIHTLAMAEGQITASPNAGLDARTRFSLLSPRQIQIVRYIGEKKTNAQIGKALGYATTTIHAECSEIYLLLAVPNRTAAFNLVADFLG
jgi:DNA-binding CsgD family transcriptional regulator